MMKRQLLSLLFAFSLLQLVGQPTITTAYFVEDGDILITRTDAMPPTSIAVQGTGQQSWDYTMLNNDGPLFQDTFLDASQGNFAALFPDAELVNPVAGGLAELYYNVTADRQELIGYAGVDPLQIGIPVHATYDPPTLFRKAPLALFDQINDFSSVSFAIQTDQLPDSIVQDLTIKPDSLKFVIENTRLGVADAWGEMTLPDFTLTVLRLNVTDYRNTAVWAKVSGFWIDATSSIQASFPNLQGLGKDTIQHYDFYSNDAKETVASVVVDHTTGEVQTVTFKASPMSGFWDVEAPRPVLTAYPNPVENEVMLKVDQVPPGNYTLKIHDILGNTIWKKHYYIHKGDNVYWEDLSRLTKGTYLLSLVNEAGMTVSTIRLIIIRP